MLIEVEAVLPVNAETYVIERDGAAMRAFIAEEMSLLEYEITECWKDGSQTKIKINSKPDVGAWIPGSLAKSIPEKLEYFDVVTYDPAKLTRPPYELTINSEAPFLGEKGHFQSRTVIEPLGPDRCRHVLYQTIEFKGMLGLGMVAKKLAKKSLQQTFDDMPKLMEKWVQVRKELLQTPRGRERLLAGRPKVEGVPWMEEHVAAIRQHGKKQRRSSKQPGHAAGSLELRADAGTSAAAVPQHSPDEAAPAAALRATSQLPTAFAPAASAGGGGALNGADGEVEQQAVEQAAGEFRDAMGQASRQATGATVFLTPTASLQPSSSHGLPAEPAVAAAGVVIAPAGGVVFAGQRKVVVVERVGLDGKPLPAQQADKASSGAGSASGASAGYSGSAEESSEESDGEGEAEWASSAAWHAFYQQRGVQPLRRDHSLHPKLVKSFIPKVRPQPVQAARHGPANLQHGGKGQSSMERHKRRTLGLCGLGGGANSSHVKE